MKFIFLICFSFILVCGLSFVCFGNVIINEIMARPLDDESMNEWIELYNNDSQNIDLKNYSMGDIFEKDALVGGQYNKIGTIIKANGYAIITDDMTRVYDNFEYNVNATRIYLEDGSFGKGGLDNAGKMIYLYDGDLIVDKINYSSTNAGKSYARLIDGWNESNPSLGFPNYIQNNTETNDSEEEDEKNKNCDWKISLFYNESRFYQSGDLQLKIVAEKIFGEKTNISSRITIKDIYGKNVKEYFPFTNYTATSKKSSSIYNPSIESNQAYFFDAELTAECDDTDITNNRADALIYANSEERNGFLDSSLKIVNIYGLTNGKAKFGQVIRAEINYYKGNSSKKAVYVAVSDGSKKASEDSQFNIDEKYSNGTIIVPIQLYPNCNNKLNEGKYSITVNGIDAATEEKISIEGFDSSFCSQIEDDENKKLTYEIIIPETIEKGKIFSVKIKFYNEHDENIKLEASSYVHLANKIYSEEARAEIVVLDGRTKELILKNSINETGQFKLKVNIRRDGKSTAESRDFLIDVKDSIKKTKESAIVMQNEIARGDQIKTSEKINRVDYIIYESDDFYIRQMIPVLVVLLFSFACIFAFISFRK